MMYLMVLRAMMYLMVLRAMMFEWSVNGLMVHPQGRRGRASILACAEECNAHTKCAHAALQLTLAPCSLHCS